MSINLCELTPSELSNYLKAMGEKSFRAQQILEWIYSRKVSKWEEMTNLSLQLRQKLEEMFTFSSLELVRTEESGDGETTKFLWKLSDGKLVESVLICSEDRRTVCVSSQVGCPARCAFCASGQKGFLKNLLPSEIMEQVLLIDRWLDKKGERVSHVVFMGMGEPLCNYESVVKTIRLLTHPQLLNISQRRVTVSTVGIIDGIQAFTQEGFKVNLVFSLHAPNQHVRKKIIPYARKYPLEEILEAMEGYAELTKRDITYEYILIADINDKEEHAHELADLLRGKQCTVNLIPYNPVEGVRLKRPTTAAIHQFRDVLEKRNTRHTCRFTKGSDIAAACGQLALQEEGL